MTDNVVSKARQELLDKMADVMMRALTEQCSVYLTDQQWYRLKEKLADTIRGQITV